MKLDAVLNVVPPDEAYLLNRKGYNRITLSNVDKLKSQGRAANYLKGVRKEKGIELFLKRLDNDRKNIDRVILLIKRLREAAERLAMKIIRGEKALPSSVVYSIPLGVVKNGSDYYVVYTYINGVSPEIDEYNKGYLNLYKDLHNDTSNELRKALFLDFASITNLLREAQILHTDIEIRNIMFPKIAGGRNTKYGLVLIDIDDGRVKKGNDFIRSPVIGGRDRPYVPDHPKRGLKNNNVRLESDRRREGFIYAYINSRGVRISEEVARKLIYNYGLLGFIRIRKEKFIDKLYETLYKKLQNRRIKLIRPPEGELLDIIKETAREVNISNKDPINEDVLELFIKYLGKEYLAFGRLSNMLGKHMIYGYGYPEARISPYRILRKISGSIIPRAIKSSVTRRIDTAPIR